MFDCKNSITQKMRECNWKNEPMFETLTAQMEYHLQL